MDYRIPAYLSIISQSLFKLRLIESVMLSNRLILCRPLLLLHSIFPSIRVFSNESVLCMRWPKWCSNFSKPGFNSTWTVKFQMFKLDLEKAEESEIKLPTSVGSSKKQKSSRKTPTSALLTMPKPLTVWIKTNSEKFFKRWEYQTTWSASWEICMQLRKQQLELDIEQQTGSKSGKEYIKAVYCHPAI